MNNFIEYKKMVDTYIERNYEKLNEVATNILFKRLHSNEHADTLVISLYEYLISSYDKLKNEKNIDPIAINWMYKQVIWKGTDFKKTYVYQKEIPMLEEYDIEDKLDDFDYIMEKEIEYENKLNLIKANIDQLDPVDSRLYELVFTLGYNNSGKLSRYTDIPRTTCWYMINELKNKLRKE